MINENMTIIEVLNTNPNTAAVFSSYGMGCIHCLLANSETVGEAAIHHGINLPEMIARLNEVCQG